MRPPFTSLRDNWWSFYSACTMHLITPPLPFGPLPFGQIAASLGFISTRLIYLLPSSPFCRLLHPVSYPLPHYSPQTQVCILPTRLARAAFHLEKSMRFPFHRKQQLLNIFIRCLIILRRSSFRDRATPRIFTTLICCILLLLPEISIQELRKSRNVSMIL